MPDDNIPSQKYRDTGILRYFVMSLIVDNLCKNPTTQVVCLTQHTPPTDYRMRHRTDYRRRTTNAAVTVVVTVTFSYLHSTYKPLSAIFRKRTGNMI